MTEYIDFKSLEQSLKGLMVKHFTADEIKALTDFYKSPAGSSVMKKFGKYSADTVPLIQREIVKAIEKIENR